MKGFGPPKFLKLGSRGACWKTEKATIGSNDNLKQNFWETILFRWIDWVNMMIGFLQIS